MNAKARRKFGWHSHVHSIIGSSPPLLVFIHMKIHRKEEFLSKKGGIHLPSLLLSQ